jgi:hypothetical protein
METDKQLRRVLVKLRSGSGLTLRQVHRHKDVLLRALNVETVESAHERLIETISAMGTTREAMALRYAYGLDVNEPLNLTKRRERVAKHWDRDSVDTVERAENRGIEELLIRLQPFSAGEGGQNMRHLALVKDEQPGADAPSEPIALVGKDSGGIMFGGSRDAMNSIDTYGHPPHRIVLTTVAVPLKNLDALNVIVHPDEGMATIGYLAGPSELVARVACELFEYRNGMAELMVVRRFDHHKPADAVRIVHLNTADDPVKHDSWEYSQTDQMQVLHIHDVPAGVDLGIFWVFE